MMNRARAIVYDGNQVHTLKGYCKCPMDVEIHSHLL